uniref:Deoxyhypusine hydroxylase n=3 Tax=Macrostomum lignano TaxID=282301 RepID=A0A1I8GDL0_9PLAT
FLQLSDVMSAAAADIKPVDEATLRSWGEQLAGERTPLVEKYRCLFGLRHAREPAAVDLIGAALFTDKSALLKHEMAYVLGQKGDPASAAILRRVLADPAQPVIVRHEAAEALGAIGTEEALAAVAKLTDSPEQELAETCQLAVRRIAWLKTARPEEVSAAVAACASVDPTPPASASESVAAMAQRLSDPSAPLYDRYCAMFGLRNVALAGPPDGQSAEEAVAGLSAALTCPESALLRHEVAFVLGQLGHPSSMEALIGRLTDQSEHGMVRHEAAEALGAIGTPRCVELLRQYLTDPEILVRESCVVALDIADYMTGSDFQYAKVPSA